MWIHGRLQSVTLVLAACLSLAVAASSYAQTRPSYPDEYESWFRIAHDEGYSAGFERGEADARARADFNYARDPDYQRADIGYRRDMTSLDRYRRVFRQGYTLGYEEGYRSYADLRGARPSLEIPRAMPRGARGSATAIAFEYGFADGYKAGLEDRRDNDRFNPTDHDAYRDGDRGYEGRYGERESYRADYRDGFHAGYTRGYREGR